MIEGILLGLASYASMVMSWWHLPQFLKKLSLKKPILTDLAASVLVFTLLTGFSKSLVAVIGAVTAGLCINFTFVGHKILKEHGTTHDT